MAKELQKPNDMLVSSMVNGNVDVMDLLKSGVNAGNTQFLDPQSYKETKLVKEKFTDKDGNFREDLFTQQYMLAAKQYQELAEMNTYKKLEDYIEYNAKDIFAPLTSKKKSIGYEISPEINPMRRSHGVKSLFEYGDSNYSMRELALMSNIWDSEKGEWMDKTAQDRGILGSLFGQSLVYATYDEDTETIDPITGRKVKHKKGEWKLNDKGQYYTETIGNRSGYGKQFVAASDTLTKEGSSLNKIDFFDSDDIEKSTIGTVMKTATKIAPYLIPGFNLYWGGLTAGIEMAKVMPTFAKMVEGIAIGGDKDKETAFTRTMNSWENYFAKYDKSYSDKGMLSNWGAEKMLDQVSDIFAQLYQMRAAASLSRLAMKDPSIKAFKQFEGQYNDLIMKELDSIHYKVNPNDFDMKSIINAATLKMPAMKEFLDKQSKLSKSLSVGYMALSSSADVYSDALAGGYDRRMAGMAGLTAALGQYGIMMAENTLNLGGWFLDEKVGYHEGVQRATMIKAIKPYYKQIAESVDKLKDASTKEEKAGIINKTLGQIIPKLKAARINGADGAQYLRNSITEALEEVTEEFVMDTTKGIYDFLSWAGIGSNKDASFGVVQDFASGSFLDRYLQNAVGGFMGGALFEFQQNKIEPFMERALFGKEKKDNDNVSLIHEIANGHTQDLLTAIDELASIDSDTAALPIDIGNEQVMVSARENTLTRGQAIAKVLKQYVLSLDAALSTEGGKLSDSQVLKKAIRDVQAIKMLEDTGLDKMVISDFANLATLIVDLRNSVQEKEDDKNKKSEEDKEQSKTDKKEAKEDLKYYDESDGWAGRSKEFRQALLDQKRQDLKKFIRGEKAAEYAYKTLVLATPQIRTALGSLSKADYARLKYDVDYKNLTSLGVLTKEKIDKEYKSWAETSDVNEKFMKFGAEAYTDFANRFSKYIKDYATSGYGDVRMKTITKLLSQGNLHINEYIDNNTSYQHIKLIANYLKGQEGDSSKKTGDLTLQDIYSQDELLLAPEVDKIINSNLDVLNVLKSLGYTEEQVKQNLVDFISAELGQLNIDNLTGSTLEALINGRYHTLLVEGVNKAKQQNPDISLKSILENAGYPYELSTEDLALSDSSQIADKLTDLVPVEGLSDVSMGLGTSLLFKYLTSENTIDGTVKKRIQEEALASILRGLSSNSESIIAQINNLVYLDSDGAALEYTMPDSKFLELTNAINANFGIVPIEEIISNWAQNIAEEAVKVIEGEDLTYFYNEGLLAVNEITVDNVKSHIVNILKPFTTEDNLYKIYKLTEGKQVKDNPVYDSLAKIAAVTTEFGQMKVFDILKDQHSNIRKAIRFEDYYPQEEAKAQLEIALGAVLMYKALANTMWGGEVTLGQPFALNKQMSNFLEANKLKDDRTYDTIDPDDVDLVLYDLQLIENQIKGYLQFGERAYTSKTEQDSNIKKQFSRLLLEALQEKAENLALGNGGISILPPKDELEKFENPAEQLAYIAHYAYKQFHENFTTAEEKGDAVVELIQKLNLDPKSITRATKPTNLNGEITKIQDIDLLLWLATALGADNHEFYYRYNELIVSNPENPYTPLFSQEQAALQAWSFVRDEKNVKVKGSDKLMTIRGAILQEMMKLNPEIVAIATPEMFFINGITGAGKSTVVGSILSVLLSDKLQYVTAPNANQAENYLKVFEKYHSPKEELQHGSIKEFLESVFGADNTNLIIGQCLEMQSNQTLDPYYKNHEKSGDALFANKDVTDTWSIAELVPSEIEKLFKNNIDISLVPEVIFIDEATQVPMPILQVIHYVADKYGSKVILSGDTVQRGAVLEGDTQVMNDLFMFKSAKLNISIRSNNNQVANNNVNFNSLLEVNERFITEDASEGNKKFKEYLLDPNNHIRISYFQDSNTFNGYKYVPNLEKFQEDIQLIAKLNAQENTKEHKPVMVITPLDAAGRPTNSNLEAILKDAGLVKEDEDFVYKSPADLHNKAVQGSEARYVIVDQGCLNNDPTEEPGEVLRSVYTFSSRAENGTLMVLPQDIQKVIGIRNEADNFTQKDEIPLLANAVKLKETRSTELGNILKEYVPEKPGIESLPKKTINGKEEYTRIGYGENEKPSAEELVEEAVSKPTTEETIAPVEDTEESTEESATEETEELPVTEPTQDSVPMYPAMDPMNVEQKPGTNDYIPCDNGINFNMDGLFDKNRPITEDMRRGYTKFKHLIVASIGKDPAKFKEAIRQGINSDNDIAYFLAEACPQVAMLNHILAWDDWKTTSKLKVLYSRWFKDKVDIDNTYYMFAKSLNWKADQPRNINGAKIEYSVGEGNPALYYGIRITSTDGYLNQYLSLGSMSKKVLPNKQLIGSKELVNLYNQAEGDLAKIQDPSKKFVAYKLNKANLESLQITSPMRFLDKLGETDDLFEDVASMRLRGFEIDSKNLYLIDNTKEGGHYKALCIMAALDKTAGDVNPYFADKRMTYEQKLAQLEETYVDDKGNLRIAGQYLTIVRYVSNNKINDSSINSKAFNRGIVLQGKKIDASVVFDLLYYKPGKFNKIENEIRHRLEVCSPSSQVEMLCSLLAKTEAFTNKDVLVKYLIGMKDQFNHSIGNGYLKDKAALDNLIKNALRKTFTEQEFKDTLMNSSHRVLLYPFFAKFIAKEGSKFKLVNAKHFAIDPDTGELNIPKDKRTYDAIDLNLSELPLSVAYPVVTQNKTRLDVSKELNLDLTGDFSLYQVDFTESRTPRMIGANRYLIQDPMYLIPNALLGDFTKVEESLEQLPREQRFPDRRSSSELPVRDANYDNSKWKPTKLTPENFVVDPYFKNLAQFDSDGKFTGRYIRGTKEHPIYLNTLNDKGFEIRIGDYVQLNGNTEKVFYVSGFDFTDPNIGLRLVLSHYGTGVLGEVRGNMAAFNTLQYIPVDDVTGVTQRTIPERDMKYIENDTYITGNFKKGSKYNQGKYIQVFKTPEVLEELINAVEAGDNSIRSLNFVKEFYLAVPIMEGELNNEDVLINPLRTDTNSKFAQAVGSQNGFRRMDIIDKPSTLRTYLKTMLNTPGVAGFTLFLMHKLEKDGNYILIDPLSSLKDDRIEKMLVSLREAKNAGRKSAYIQHQVMFNTSETPKTNPEPLTIKQSKEPKVETRQTEPVAVPVSKPAVLQETSPILPEAITKKSEINTDYVDKFGMNLRDEIKSMVVDNLGNLFDYYQDINESLQEDQKIKFDSLLVKSFITMLTMPRGTDLMHIINLYSKSSEIRSLLHGLALSNSFKLKVNPRNIDTIANRLTSGNTVDVQELLVAMKLIDQSVNLVC